jgi:hypothetical protein
MSTLSNQSSTISLYSLIKLSHGLEGKAWGDVSDDEDFPPIGTDLEQRKRDKEIALQKEAVAETQAVKAFNQSLSKKREITIKWSGDNEFSRSLRVSSQTSYESLLRLIARFKSHDKNGRLNHREQEAKIKLANTLLSTTYKVTNKPLFIYHTALIHLYNGTILSRDEVEKDSTAPFELVEHSYEPIRP